MINIFRNLSSGLEIKFVNFWNLIFDNTPSTKGVNINKNSWIKDSAILIRNSTELELITVSQKIIVNGDNIETKEVKKTDKGTFPFLMYVNRPDIWPPGTIRTIAAAIENIELSNNFEARMPIKGMSKSWINIPRVKDFFSEKIILNWSKLLFNPKK